jgi:hypothetical protein
VIRDAVLHVENEQPLLADLYRLPEPTDLGLLCTNLRTLNGKRPVFVDDMASAFFFPYRIIRFVEIPPGRASAADVGAAMGEFASVGAADDAAPVAQAPELAGAADGDLELDEDFLRRVREI